ncbi:MAG: beta-mannosidase [Prolixibacteraceae bacterium]|nr:beta-mannosidase [Prolixibacteraceae bacterium]
MKKLLFFFTLMISLSFMSCVQNNDNSPVEKLTKNLQSISGKHILFGHQDDLAYGIGWKSISGESDVKRIAGSYPALFGWELGSIGKKDNIDGVPFDSIKVYIQRAHRLGGINSISWHAENPLTGNDSWNLENINVPELLPGGKNHKLLLRDLELVASFLNSLKDDEGNLIPVIFRPWHEMYGNWFWWGVPHCSSEDYKKLFVFTIDYLRKEKKLSNLLIAFSPDKNFNTKEEYLKNYPGDDYVDILGLDDYGDFRENRLDQIVVRLGIIADLAKEKNKISAFTETGSDKLAINNWYTTNLLHVLKANDKTRSISYVMVWRNRDTEHFYVPYKGHQQEEDFLNFVNDKIIILLEGYNNFLLQNKGK